MSKTSLHLLVALALASGWTHASDLVQFPKGPAAWTVAISPSALHPGEPSAKPSPTQLLRLNVTQNEKARQIDLSHANGATSQKLLIVATNYILVKHSNGIVVGYPNSGEFGSAYEVPFQELAFSWIVAKSLFEDRPVLHGGKKCYHYKGTVRNAEADNPDDSEHPRFGKHAVEAWIDSETLLPVALDDGVSLATYTFLPPPYPAVTIPTDFQATFNRLSR